MPTPSKTRKRHKIKLKKYLERLAVGRSLIGMHTHQFTRSKEKSSVETCTCGKFRFTEHAGPSIEAVTDAGKAPRIIKAYIRDYSDNGQTTAYIEWSDGSRTEGSVNSAHIQALFRRADREGITVNRETW